jgi:hypothetical protein
MKDFNVTPYNKRLFTGLRGRLHRLRYQWLVERLRTLESESVSLVELGCYDAKTIQFLDEAGIRVARYLGLDANWEKGLDLAGC